MALLSAPVEGILHRVTARQTNPHGKRQEGLEQTIGYVGTVEPLLWSGCDLEINTAQLDVQRVAGELIRIAGG